MTIVSDVLTAALALPAEARAEVAHKLLLSLEPDEVDFDADHAWADEVRRRLSAIREGRAAFRDWNEALEDMRRSLTFKDGA